jgi:hypothetical protein
LGDRLKPAGAKLRKAILDGSIGEIPLWGYKLLNCDLDASLAEFTTNLESKELAMRQRATLALGYMGKPAVPAKSKLEEAATRAQTPGEKKLLNWAIKKVQAD